MSDKESCCPHPKETKIDLWCRACAEKAAGPKPNCRWEVGMICIEKCTDYPNDFGRVRSVEMKLCGTATTNPSWHEHITYSSDQVSGGGDATMFKRLRVLSDDEW